MNKLIGNKAQKLVKGVVATSIAVTMLFSTAFAANKSDSEKISGYSYKYYLNIGSQYAAATTVYEGTQSAHRVYTYVTATECLKTNENITKTLIIPSASRYYEEGEAFSGVTASSGADSGYKITKATSTHVLVIGSQQVVRTLSVEN